MKVLKFIAKAMFVVGVIFMITTITLALEKDDHKFTNEIKSWNNSEKVEALPDDKNENEIVDNVDNVAIVLNENEIDLKSV